MTPLNAGSQGRAGRVRMVPWNRGVQISTTMTPQFLTALRKLVETLDKHQTGSRYLLALTAVVSTTALLLTWLGVKGL